MSGREQLGRIARFRRFLNGSFASIVGLLLGLALLAKGIAFAASHFGDFKETSGYLQIGVYIVAFLVIGIVVTMLTGIPATITAPATFGIVVLGLVGYVFLAHGFWVGLIVGAIFAFCIPVFIYPLTALGLAFDVMLGREDE